MRPVADRGVAIVLAALVTAALIAFAVLTYLVIEKRVAGDRLRAAAHSISDR